MLLARAGSIILQIAFLMQNRSDPILDGSMCESNMFCRAKCISNKGQGATRHLGGSSARSSARARLDTWIFPRGEYKRGYRGL